LKSVSRTSRPGAETGASPSTGIERSLDTRKMNAMKLPGINDVANASLDIAKGIAKGLEKAGGRLENSLEKTPGKIDKAATKAIEGLFNGADLLSDAAARTIRSRGELLATGVEVFGDAGTKVIDAQLDVASKFADVFGGILDKRIDQAGRLGEILIGKNPLLKNLDIFDLLAARKCGTVEQMPGNNLKAMLERIRELLENGGFGRLPGIPEFEPQPTPGKGPTPADVPAGALKGLMEQIRELMAALVEAIKQRGGQAPGSTEKLPDITNPPAVGGSGDAGDFKDAIFGQVRTIDDKISTLRAEISSGKLTPEQAQEKMIELQELMQQKMQLIQMLTNLMKTEHDMAMAVIRNLAV